MYYYLLLGSNISPERNLGRTIEEILINFQEGIIFPSVYTKPEKIKTKNVFMNTIMVIQSNLEKTALKKTLECIEEKLGRNRSDPKRSVKDRTCDIDILECSNSLEMALLSNTQDAYVKKILRSNYSHPGIKVFECSLTNNLSKVCYDPNTEELNISDLELSI